MSEIDFEQSTLCEDLTNWMTNLPPILKKIPIIHLAIPGSHDSVTSSITCKSKISPDAGPTLEKLNCLGPVAGLAVCRWVKTQNSNVSNQLNMGIRYFDLRISTKEGTEQLFFVHGQYSDDVVSVFNDLENFLDDHPKEVVVLDCQHFYDFTERDHQRFIRLIKATFGPKLLPAEYTMEHITLEYITEKHHRQVILVYRNYKFMDKIFFWEGLYFQNPWPETTNKIKLIEFLDLQLRERSNQAAFISQFLLTPTTSSIILNCFSSLKRSYIIPIQKLKYKWLSEQSPRDKGLNIVIADCVDLENAKFPKFVIALNEVYLSE